LVQVGLALVSQPLVEVDPVGGYAEPDWLTQCDARSLVDLDSGLAVVDGGALLR
jgi:hypothetical protein